MKKLLFISVFIIKIFNAYSQDSTALVILPKLQDISDCEFSFQRHCIYGEFHDYKMTNIISEKLFSDFYKGKTGKITYFIEGSSSVEYILSLHKDEHYYLYYNSLKILFKDINKIKPLIKIYEQYKDQSQVSFKSIDLEGSFMLSLLCLKDIIGKSTNSGYFQWENLLMNKIINRSNSKLMTKAKDIVMKFENDSLKYFNNLTNKDYWFYSSIIKDLKAGIIHEEKFDNVENRNEAMEFRESYMLTKIVCKLDSNTSFFLQCGLLHSLDSVGSLLWSTEWISLAERLKRKYGKMNFTKIALINLNEKAYINTRILNERTLVDLSRRKINIPSVINLTNIVKLKTEFNYAILYK